MKGKEKAGGDWHWSVSGQSISSLKPSHYLCVCLFSSPLLLTFSLRCYLQMLMEQWGGGTDHLCPGTQLFLFLLGTVCPTHAVETIHYFTPQPWAKVKPTACAPVVCSRPQRATKQEDYLINLLFNHTLILVSGKKRCPLTFGKYSI